MGNNKIWSVVICPFGPHTAPPLYDHKHARSRPFVATFLGDLFSIPPSKTLGHRCRWPFLEIVFGGHSWRPFIFDILKDHCLTPLLGSIAWDGHGLKQLSSKAVSRKCLRKWSQQMDSDNGIGNGHNQWFQKVSAKWCRTMVYKNALRKCSPEIVSNNPQKRCLEECSKNVMLTRNILETLSPNTV